MATYAAGQMPARARRPAVSAGDPILAAKITAPSVPDWALPRPRITKLIAEGTRWCPLTVVTAPAGAGKTMALTLWAAAEPGAVAWVTLDGYDNRPGVFWSYVVAALHRSGVAVPGQLPADARGRAADHVFLLRLASALAAQNPPVTLVLDDFHLLTDPKVAAGLGYVLRNVGPGLRLVVCSRMDPMLPLHRYRLAGELAEIRASELAFSIAEAGLLIAQHGITLPAGLLECLTRRTEGWAAGIRLAAISMDAHPDPDRFVKELVTEDSALTGYLVAEVLNAQPPDVRDVLLSTSILEQVSGEAASELAGNEQAAGILPPLAHANAFVQPLGGGWYRYHTLFAEVLRLKLRHEYPDRMAALHRRAARWYERNGLLADAVRHAAEVGDWQLASSMIIDGLAIGEIIEPRGGQSLAGELHGMPHSGTWIEPQPHLVSAAVALSAGRPASSIAALNVAEGILGRLPADQEAASQLAAAMIRLTAALRTGDLAAAAAAAARAEVLVSRVPGDKLARRPEIRARMLSGRGAVELWSGHLDEAARALGSGVIAATASGSEDHRADCLGQLALVEALRGRPRRAAQLAAAATAAPTTGERRAPGWHPSPAALVALAWVHLEHNELREAGSRLKQVDTALGVAPDKLIEAVACLVLARAALAGGRTRAAAQSVARARSGCSVPPWLEQRLSLAESRACAADGIRAALAVAARGGPDDSPEADPELARTRRRLFAPTLRPDQLPAPWGAPEQAPILVAEPLTEREREVLLHLSSMLSSAEIATVMYISINTVKTHLRHIYRKLATAHRSEAVRRARQLGLI